MILFCASNAAAQDGLFGSVSGYGEPMIQVSQVEDHTVLLAGAKLGVILGGRLMFAAHLSNMISQNVESQYLDPKSGRRPYLTMDFYAFELGYIFTRGEKFHFFARATGGWGYVNYFSDLVRIEDEVYNPDYGYDLYYTLEPRIALLMEINDWIYLAADAGWRIAIGADYEYRGEVYDNSRLSGYTIQISVIFGTMK